MPDTGDRIEFLLNRLDSLSRQQDLFLKEIAAIRLEVQLLQTARKITSPTSSTADSREAEKPTTPIATAAALQSPPATPTPSVRKTQRKNAIEKFIGENLISKVGIGITIIGAAIGAKYSIEHKLLSPLLRIIAGYLLGGGLLGLGLYLRKKYDNYSAVLISGAMAISYFMTYAAFVYYNMYSQLVAFMLMTALTIATVSIAVSLNKQVIALIGQVGAYAVPLLLSDGSGKAAILFSYITIINCGVLAVALRKYWKLLYYAAFAISWIIYISWYFTRYTAAHDFTIAAVFLTVFFLIFYSIFLVYKVNRAEKFVGPDVALLLINAFVFYSIGYELISDHFTGHNALTLFTVFNGLLHLTVATLLYKRKSDINLRALVIGLALLFITIAIPVALNGSWVTILWSGEALLLFLIGRRRQEFLYERLSYPLIPLAFVSQLQDWFTEYGIVNEQRSQNFLPLFNSHLFSSLLFIGVMLTIVLVARKNAVSPANRDLSLTRMVELAVAAILVFAVYYSFRLEIEHYWNLQLLRDDDIRRREAGWLSAYNFLFAGAGAIFNLKWLKNRQLAICSLLFNVLATVQFLGVTLYLLNTSPTALNGIGNSHAGLKYLCLMLLAAVLYLSFRYIRSLIARADLKVMVVLYIHATILWSACAELVHLLVSNGFMDADKLAISILWGVYSLFLVVLGIWKKAQYLRIVAIVLFTATLIKLFFYDIAALSSIRKTIVFVSLGILLLIISFLYNRYKHIIGETEPS